MSSFNESIDPNFVTPKMTKRAHSLVPHSRGSAISRAVSELSFDSSLEKKLVNRTPTKSNSPVKESVMVVTRAAWVLTKDETTGVDKRVLYVDIPKVQLDDDCKSFLKKMAKKAAQLDMNYVAPKSTVEYTGQCGMIVNDLGQYHMVTARHNTTSDSRKEMRIRFTDAFYRSSQQQCILCTEILLTAFTVTAPAS